MAAEVTSPPIAVIDGDAISAEEVDTSIAPSVAKLREQIYNLQREKLEALIAERLLAKEATRRGLSVPALLEAEVTAKAETVTDQEVENFLATHRDRLKGEEPQVRGRIRGYLQSQKLAERRDAFLATLRSRANVVINLKAPPTFRAAIDLNGAPAKGAAKPSVIIIKFEDFDCPFCRESQPTFAKLLSLYEGKIRVVHKDFPIEDLHPGVEKAHEAARCANEQGQFWAYHDKLYSAPAQPTPDNLTLFASELGLDLAAFKNCLASGKYKAAVQNDIEDGVKAGVTGTPAFFINGRPIAGAQPIERFVEVIEEELAHQREK